MLHHSGSTDLRPTPGVSPALRNPSEGLGSTPDTRASYAAAARAVLCFVLYGEQVIREVRAEKEATALRTFSLLPIPIACRPDSSIPRRGNPAPVSSPAVVDAHGILAYAAAVGGALVESGARSPGAASPEQLELVQTEAFRRDREALGRLADTLSQSRPAETFYPEYWQEAERLLCSHWVGVEMVAEVLQRHPVLNGERIDKILCEAFPV